MPIWVSAFLISSNLKCRTIASIFFTLYSPSSSIARERAGPPGESEIVPHLTMLREIEPVDLVLLGHSQANRGIDDDQGDYGYDNREAPGDRDGDELIDQLLGISREQ